MRRYDTCPIKRLLTGEFGAGWRFCRVTIWKSGHIPGKKNPADSLSRQLVADALVRKDSVKDANAEHVQKLRVNERATDQEIQDALHQLFNSSP